MAAVMVCPVSFNPIRFVGTNWLSFELCTDIFSSLMSGWCVWVEGRYVRC